MTSARVGPLTAEIGANDSGFISDDQRSNLSAFEPGDVEYEEVPEEERQAHEERIR